MPPAKALPLMGQQVMGPALALSESWPIERRTSYGPIGNATHHGRCRRTVRSGFRPQDRVAALIKRPQTHHSRTFGTALGGLTLAGQLHLVVDILAARRTRLQRRELDGRVSMFIQYVREGRGDVRISRRHIVTPFRAVEASWRRITELEHRKLSLTQNIASGGQKTDTSTASS
ncbi:uncharacterized protein BXZ73DRAFT_73953 [Epithele typhae]|uniref:uncharacterized protein n=1 Tax=Epithele typhae TaxID=378194 RepID=UPI002007D325|nr:uncharacterized protein BXZ73DRAFT_73953 [Epithele typhae]KAH9944439.1 hypothetical protein BXZ73DRAFT_73953 [Epithele typhae]